MPAVDPEPADGEARTHHRRQEQYRIAERLRVSEELTSVRRHHSTSAANAAADSLDFGMKPRAPHASICPP